MSTDLVAQWSFQRVCSLSAPKPSNVPPLLRGLAFSPGGECLAGAFDRYLTIWVCQSDLDNSSSPLEHWIPKAHYNVNEDDEHEEYTFLTWTKSNIILAGTNSGYVKLIEIKPKGTRIDRFQATFLPVRCMALSEQENLLAIVAGDNEVTLWDPPNDPKDPEDSWTFRDRLSNPHSRIANDELLQVTSIAFRNDDGTDLLVSYLHHGVVMWSTSPEIRSRSLIHPDKVFSVSSSPDGQLLSVPNRKGTFDIFELPSKDRLHSLKDDPRIRSLNASQRFRPGQFIHQGGFFIGASVGKVNIWDVQYNIRSQQISLADPFSERPVVFLTVSDTDDCAEYRFAACPQGPDQEIEIWKGKVYSPSFQAPLEEPIVANDTDLARAAPSSRDPYAFGAVVLALLVAAALTLA